MATTVTPRQRAFVAAQKAKRAPLRPLDQSIANERELGAKVSQNAARTKAKLASLRAKNTYEPPRRDEIADRDIFNEIQSSLRNGHKVRLTGRTPSLVIGGVGGHKLSSPAQQIVSEERDRVKAGSEIGIIRRRLPVFLDAWRAIDRVDRYRRRRGEIDKMLWVPHWDRTGPFLKALAWAMAIWERGGQVLTLNIHEAVADAARRDRRGFATHMRERLKRELSKATKDLGCPVPEFFFVVEASDLGKPHIHGGIILPDDPGYRDVIKKALYAAAFGRQEPEKRTGREVHFGTYATPAVWANYTVKWARGSAENIDGRVFAASTGARSMGKAWYVRMRDSEAEIDGHAGEEFTPLV